ncbi:D-aminoacyl-tRNA deacylase, partial [Patescibacteria group bacterium]|nr:D-aminoacyl-tRNA deacylase [Patescibacteria group bacterium]
MRLVVQRVKKASVRITESKRLVGKIDEGLFVLVGVKEGDSEENAERLA